MRVNIPHDSDSNYTLYTNKDGDRDGSILSFMNLVAGVVSEAVNQLPDKSALADLLFESKCSWYSTSYRLVESVLSIFELLKLVDYFVQEGLIPFPKNVLDSSRDPKPFLIEALFKEEISMSKTIDAAQVKEGMESSFDINKFLDGHCHS